MEKEPAGVTHELGMPLAYQALGQQEKSDAALNELLTRYPNDGAYQIAQVYAYRAEVDQAFVWLDRAYQQHDPGLMWLKTNLKMNSVRNDPRYKQLLKTLNLPD
jgi:hypothetical protein